MTIGGWIEWSILQESNAVSDLEGGATGATLPILRLAVFFAMPILL